MAIATDVNGEGLLVEADAQAPSGPPLGHGLALAVGGRLAEFGGELLGRKHPASDPLEDLFLGRPGVGLQEKASVR